MKHSVKFLALVKSLLFLCCLIYYSSASTVLQAKDVQSKPQVYRGAESIGPITPHIFTGDLRNLPRAPMGQIGDTIKEIPKMTYPRGGKPGEKGATVTSPLKGPDPLIEKQKNVIKKEDVSRSFSTPSLNFSGQGFTFVNPPDTVGDVGINYYIQMVNALGGAQFTIYNKSDGSVAAGPTLLDSLAPSGTNCAFGLGDPIVLFDHLANRWLMSEFSANANALCVYISQTADPITGGWFVYEFATPDFPDYPKYGVWPDAYYVSTNESSPAVYALDRSNMLNGSSATMQRFTASNLSGFGFQALIPSDLDGALAPPAGSPNYFMRHRDDEAHNAGSNDPTQDYLEIWEFSVDFVTPANSTFTGPTNIPITEIDSDLCGLTSFDCFPQPGSTVTLDPLREVAMWRSQYRNFGTHETMVGNLVTDVDNTDHGGIRWFEMRNTGSGWSLFQEGTFSPDSDNRWMGSISMDGEGNIAMGYNVVSTSTFPGIRYVGRVASDPLGTMPLGEFTIINGAGSNNSNRYGDYSSINIDPVDDKTFWFTGEYTQASGNWATQIAAFSFSQSAQSAQPAQANTCYASTGLNDGGNLLTINPETGAGTLIGPTGLVGAPGLASNSKGDLYCTERTTGDLYRVDAATGQASLVGPTGVSFMDALAFDGDVLYGVSNSLLADNLYTIDTATGASTIIGPLGGNARLSGMACDPITHTLYGSGAGIATVPDEIYTINKTTGAATLIGTTGLGGSTPDLHFNAAGVLFGSKGGGSNPNNLIAIDKSTGAGTVIGPIGFTSVSGLTFVPPKNVIECDLQLNTTLVNDGDLVALDVFRVANTGSAWVPIEWSLFLRVPGLPIDISLLNIGADGTSVVFHPGFNVDNGPLDLFVINSNFPRGLYILGCRLENPITKKDFVVDINHFVVQ